MDTELLAAYEQQLSETTRTAYDADATLDDPRWPNGTGRIHEDAGNVVDYLKRTLHGIPNDGHYAREKSGALVDATITLHQRLMEADIICDRPIEVYVTDPDGDYTMTHGCCLPTGHAGDHDHTNRTLRQLLDAADTLDKTVTELTRRIRWSVLHHDEYTPEALDEVSGELVDLGGELRHRLDAYRATGRPRAAGSEQV